MDYSTLHTAVAKIVPGNKEHNALMVNTIINAIETLGEATSAAYASQRNNVSVTFYPHSLKPQAGVTMPLWEILAGIREGRWAKPVQAVRAIDATTPAYSTAKKQLPGFTASGIFTSRCTNGLQQHSGLICLDLDVKFNAGIDWVAARQRIETDVFTHACFASTGGNGLAVLVCIPIDDHRSSFAALAAYYRDTLGLQVDDGCKSVCQLRYVSNDPALYWNPAAHLFEFTTPPPTPPDLKATPITKSQASGAAVESYYGLLELEAACERVRAAPDGHKHYVLNKNAFLCGGYIGAGFLRESVAQQALENAIGSRQVDSFEAAVQTIRAGLHDGQAKPLLPGAVQCIVQQDLRRTSDIKVVVAKLAARQGISAYVLEPAVCAFMQELTQEPSTVLAFWEMGSGHKPHTAPKPHLSFVKFQLFLTYHGFYKWVSGSQVRVVQLRDHVVYTISRVQLKDFVQEYLRSLPDEFDGTTREAIQELVFRQHRLLFENDHCEWLSSLPGQFLRDTATHAYLCYRNGAVVVTKEGFEVVPYAELLGLVWDTQLLDRDFVLLPPTEIEAGNFSQFLQHLANHQADRRRHLLLFLGYYLHGYKDPSNPKIGVLLDEVRGVEGEANGGTGKSLLFKALGHIVSVVEIDGRGYDPRNAKELQQVTDTTRVIVLNDWAPALPFERLFNMATDTLTVDRHYSGKQSYPYANSPKIGLTTNSILTGRGGSHDRRRYELEIFPHYGPTHQPRDEFGVTFFSGWSALEWSRFDALMVQAVCLFLSTDGRLTTPASANLAKRRLVALTSSGFVTFMDAQPRGRKLDRNQLLQDFLQAEGYESGAFPTVRFGGWLKYYADYHTPMQQGQERAKANRGKRWLLLTPPETSVR